MPEAQEPRRFDIALVPGMDRSSPAHFLHREGGVSFARVLNNLRPDRGELARRPGMVALSSMPTLELPGPWKVIHVESLSNAPDATARVLLVTQAEVFLRGNGSWFNLTPIYTVGTVSVTNGSPTVTGAGTVWFDRGIYGTDADNDGNWFKGPDGAWYKIDAVSSNTSITLATNYAGGTTAGASYTIRRTFRNLGSLSAGFPGSWLHHVFTHRINEDLYLGGWVSGGLFTTANAADGGVIKIPDAYVANKSSWSAANTDYITSGRNDPTGACDNLGDNLVVMGLGGLADGRLVLPAHFYRPGGSVTGSATIYYSSHLNTAVWTTSPAGFVDIIDFAGSITAAEIGTTRAAIHFEDGIEIAELTGQDDPPLRLRPSNATVGAIGPKMIAKCSGDAVPGSSLFVGSDAALYAWNGITAIPVSAQGASNELSFEANGATGPIDTRTLQTGFSITDGHRNETAFFFPRVTGDQGSMREVRFNYQTGELWRGQYRGLIYCAAIFRRGNPDAWGPAWAGSPPADQVVLGTETDTSWLWRLSEAASSDGYDDGQDGGGIYGIWDGIDGGRPETWKTTQEILVYLKAPFHATAAATTLKLRWYTDSTPAGEELTATVTPARTQYEQDFLRPEYVAIFRGFDTKPWRTLSFVLASNDDNVFAATISRMTLFYAEHGDARAL